MTEDTFEGESTTYEKYCYGDYEIEVDLLESLASDLTCPLCLSILKDPTLTSCCGHHFCAQCIKKLKADNMPCPVCREQSFSTMIDKSKKRIVMKLHVACVNKSKGCKWIGELGDLDGHLNRVCQSTLLECPLHCGESYMRKDLDNHKNHCPQRISSCPHCGFNSTYQILMDEHTPICQYYPVKCPNDCGVTCERQDLAYHEKICDEARHSCKFSTFGCDAELTRHKVNDHMKDSIEKHLSLLADSTLRLMEDSQTTNNAVQGTDVESVPAQQQGVKHSSTIREMQTKCEDKVKENVEAKKVVLASVIYPASHCIFLPNLMQSMYNRECIDTDAIYSHEKGYKFMLQVWPYGDGKTLGTHVSADIYPVCGEYDHELLWPVNLTFTFLVVDQSADRNHLKIKVKVFWTKEDIGMFFNEHSFELIAHSRLENSTAERAQFIKDDTMLLQYTEVHVQY